MRANTVTVNVDPATWQRLTNYAHFMGLSYSRSIELIVYRVIGQDVHLLPLGC